MRPTFEETFAQIALIWAKRSTCTRRQVGAVLVKDNKVIGNGYNGAASGRPHCIDGGCPRGRLDHEQVEAGADYNQFPCVAIHAEHNAILQAGIAESRGSVLYTTEPPCQQCQNLIEHAGIEKVILVEGNP